MTDDEPEFEGNESSAASESSVRSALFAAVEGGVNGGEGVLSCRPLVKLFFLHEPDSIQEGITLSTRQQRDTLLNYIRSHKFHKGYARRFFAGMANILKKVIGDETYVPASAYESDEEENKEGEILPDEESTEALMYLKACAICVSSYLDGLVDRRCKDDPSGKTYNVIDEAFAVGELLHDVLISLQSYCGQEGLKVQNAVATLCEKWWHKNFVDRDYMVVQLIPFLVIKSLDGSAKKNDVKRLFILRDAFQLLDFEEDTIAHLRSLLLKTISSPLYPRMPEGRKLIAYLFCLHESLVRDLHNAIRAQIPDAKKSILEAYGDIYFKAWNESDTDSPIRICIEETALQDLMYAVIHVSTPSMVKAIQAVLQPFYDAKKSKDVGNLLYRMYGPILWRSLESTNICVRVNASDVLVETFPLHDPTSGHKHLEKYLTQGTTALEKLLCHSHPKVRIAGLASTAKILIMFWDALPTADIHMLLNHIVIRLSSDASSSAVRAAAISTVTVLLDAPQSHAILRPLLPSVGNLIHDKVERVRYAAVRMLLCIKKTSGIKYYHVVPVDHLLARLAEDGRHKRQGLVASSITSLMLNSYFPQGENVSGADQIKRTVSFLTAHPDAASIFYYNVASHLSINSVSKLTAMLLTCLSSAIETDKAQKEEITPIGGKKRRREGPTQIDKDSKNSHGPLTASNTQLMASIAETICNLYDSIESDLKIPQNSACHDFLLGAFSGMVLTNVHVYFEQKALNSDLKLESGIQVRDDCYRVCAAVLHCAGRLPLKAVEGMSFHVMSTLSNVKTTNSRDYFGVNLAPHLALLCLWGMTEDVAKSLASSIECAFSGKREGQSRSFERVPNSNKRKSDVSTTKEMNLSVPSLPPTMALTVLSDIICGTEPSNVEARSYIVSSTSACGYLEDALEHATAYAERVLIGDPLMREVMEEIDISFVLKACEAYGKLALHKEASRDGPLLLGPLTKTLLLWTTDKVVPVILSWNPLTPNPLKDLNISRISAATDSPIAPCSPTPLEPPLQRSNRNSTPVRFSFDSIGNQDKMAITSEDDTTSVRAAALSLIKSSCFIFSEWLAIGGGEGGAEEIAGSASKWCQVLSCPSSGSMICQEALLPAFCRLATQLCLKANNFSLMNAVVINCVVLEREEDEHFLQKTVSTILCGRDSSVMSSIVDALLATLYELLERSKLHGKEDLCLPVTISDLWGEHKGSFKSSLCAIFSNQDAALIIGERLVEDLKECKGHALPEIALFQARCVWVLCERLSGHHGSKLKNLVRQLDVHRYESDTKVLVGEIVDGIA